MPDLTVASRRRALLAEGVDANELPFELALDEAVEYLVALAEKPEPGKPGPNAAQVGPDARHKLKGLLRYYAKKPHPFAACVRDNTKRFGPRVYGVCAVLKDIIRGTTHWRGHNNPRDHGAPGVATALSEDGVVEALMDDDVANALYALSREPDGVARLLGILNAPLEGESS